jgi:hypothetical protein
MSRVRVLLEPLEDYMVVNFRVHRIFRGARKLVWTPTLIKKQDEHIHLRTNQESLLGYEIITNEHIHFPTSNNKT